MNEEIRNLQAGFFDKLKEIRSQRELEDLRIAFLGKKGLVTALLKNLGGLSEEAKRSFGREVNDLKREISEQLAMRMEGLRQEELQRELDAVPELDVSMPPVFRRGSYHPITLVQRQCENVFRSMSFTLEDYSEVVTDYECFESLNIP
ncbi:MAG: phenylalanine--tRNA ligase subunit alpha, partial [Oscillospiraceae bacterium]|nr:phenylalanine--tRNA ligase subunit alpha [Oscillospiraceae bacterium]